jgi:four helix bundle protein
LTHWLTEEQGLSYKDDELKERTKRFAVRIFKLTQSLESNGQSRVVARQLLRSGTSVAANYRAVCRARSKAEFIAKIGIVVEEIDETAFWLEFLTDVNLVTPKRLEDLIKGANELLAIFAASQRTAKGAAKAAATGQ